MGSETIANTWAATAMGESTTASGSVSTAMGYDTTASGSYSTAMGSATTASFWASTAMGEDTTASANYATAMGQFTTASGVGSTAMGNSVTADGNYSFGIGLIYNATPPTITRTNVMAIMGGTVGIETVDPKATLHVAGEIIVGNTALVCSATTAGALRYNSGALELCNGTTWGAAKSPPISNPGAPFDPNWPLAAFVDYSTNTAAYDNTQLYAQMATQAAMKNAKAELAQAAKQYTFEAAKLWQAGEDEAIYYTGDVAIGAEDAPSDAVVYGEFACYESFHAYGDATIEGRLGVGTDAPEFDLDVNGDARFTEDVIVNGTQTIDQSLVILGTDAGEYSLEITGAAFATEGWYEPSDRRLKKQIEPLYGALDALLKLRGVSYQWRDASCHDDDRHLGMIAQQVERFFPEWVKTDSNGFKAVSYEGFEALTVEAMREVAVENEDQDARIEKLEAANAELHEELAQIKILLKRQMNKR
jgi:hypothetical protein